MDNSNENENENDDDDDDNANINIYRIHTMYYNIRLHRFQFTASH